MSKIMEKREAFRNATFQEHLDRIAKTESEALTSWIRSRVTTTDVTDHAASLVAPNTLVDPQGAPLSVLFQEQSDRQSDLYPVTRGILTHRWFVDDPNHLSDQGRPHRDPTQQFQAAYLAVSYATEELNTLAFPTIWHYVDKREGILLRSPVDGTLVSDDEILSHLLRSSVGVDLPREICDQMPSALAWAEHPPSSELRDRILAVYAAHFTEKWSRTPMLNPFVAFINTDPAFTRRGLATTLYRTAASFLATRGLILRESSLQSDTAQALWKHLAATDPHATTITETYPSGDKVFRALDYRTVGL